MDVGTWLSEVSGGLLQFIPDFGKALLHCFISLFFATSGGTESAPGEVTGLSILGVIATSMIIISLCMQMLPTVLGWMRMGMSKMRRGKKAKKTTGN